MIDLVESLIPWLAAAFLVTALVLVAVLTVMASRSRAEEAEAMRLVGGSTVTVWVRIGLVIAVPTVMVVAVTTGAVAIAAPSIAAWVLPTGVAITGVAGTLISTGLLAGTAAIIVLSVASLAAVWRVATK